MLYLSHTKCRQHYSCYNYIFVRRKTNLKKIPWFFLYKRFTRGFYYFCEIIITEMRTLVRIYQGRITIILCHKHDNKQQQKNMCIDLWFLFPTGLQNMITRYYHITDIKKNKVLTAIIIRTHKMQRKETCSTTQYTTYM